MNKRLMILTLIFSLCMTLFGQSAAMAAVDTATSLPELQSYLDTAMHSRQTTYSVVYSGGTSTIGADVPKLINNILDADDYLKYTYKGYRSTYTISSTSATFNITFNYWNTAAMDSYVDTRVTEILNQIITPEMNDYQKEKAIHDWIEANVAYDSTLIKHSDYDALVSPYKTVCQGYALLAYKMLNQAGIQTKIVEGVAGGSAHAWNLVYLDGKWYHYDGTWDDPVPDVAGRILYDYFNLTDSQIKTNHTWTKTYPTANTLFADTLNAKLLSDPENAAIYEEIGNAIGLQYLTPAYTVNNAGELTAKIQEAINNNTSAIKVRYMSGSTVVTDISTAIKSISNITYYSYSKAAFLRSPETNDVLLSLSFTYNPPVNVTGVSITPTTLALAVGGTTGTLTPVVAPSNASNKNIIWTSSNPSVATVTNGVVKAVAGGTAVITATTADGGFTAVCNVTVTQKVTGITLDKTTSYLKIGEPDLTLNATVNPATATDKRIAWTSSNPAVATVDGTGKVHAVAVGTAVIKATSVQDPTKYARCTITVPVVVTGVSLKPAVTVKMGTTAALVPVFTPTTATIKTVTWSSSDLSIVKVSTTGVLTPVAPGTATVTVTTTDGGFTASCTVTVIYGVTSITLDKTSSYLKVGAPDLALTATVNPTNATNKSITWTSSNPAVATVDGTGKVHAVAVGTAVIKVTSVQDQTKYANCTITVPVVVTGVSLKPAVTVKMGTTAALVPVFTPTTATIKTGTWSSSDLSIVKVSTTGVLTPVAPGTATVTVTTTDGGFTASCTVTVIYGVTSITLDKTSSYLKVGAPDLALTATVNPTNATNKSITWTSSNPAVATVDGTGKVHAVAVGTAVIKVTSVQDTTKYASCKITVPVVVTGVSLKPTVTVKMGTTAALVPVFTPTTATIKTGTWSSSDLSIVKVSTTGVLTPVSPGTATVTVTTTDGGFTASCTVTVVYGVTSVTLDKTTAYLKLGAADLALTATVNPTTATNKSVTWTTSNPSVATVDASGKVHAAALGTAVIKAVSVQDPTKTASCTVTVQP